jgi:SMI1-KNR4 cell-wall
MAEMAVTLAEAIRPLRELNEPVPKPMRLPSAAAVAAAERELGVTFHPDYRKFLLEASDVVYGTLEPATIGRKRAHTDLVRMAHDAWTLMELPRELLPICDNNADYYCMNGRGEVVYWSHDGLTDERWPNLAAWIQQVWIEEN